MDAAQIKSAAEELIASYVQCLDDGQLEQWPEFFTETATYKIVARENVERHLPLATMSCTSKNMMKDRVVAIRKASVYSPRYLRHLVSNIRVAGQQGECHLVDANYVVFQTLENQETKVFNAGRYRSKMVFGDDGCPKFQEKLVIYDSLQIPGMLVIPI